MRRSNLLLTLGFFCTAVIPLSAQNSTIQDAAPAAVAAAIAADQASAQAVATSRDGADSGFQWGRGLGESVLFLGVQHGIRFFTEEKTREQLDGPFWDDYVASVKGLRGWDDGGKVFTNYIAHPAQGGITGYIWLQNSRANREVMFGGSSRYWTSRIKAMLWTAAWSAQFEIGPVSEASIGNVGKIPGTQGYVDLAITPVMGTVLIISEDVMDRYVWTWLDRHVSNRPLRALLQSLSTPTRSAANTMRFRVPWYRDGRPHKNVPKSPAKPVPQG